MARRAHVAEPILRTSEENHRVFVATCNALSAVPSENCKAEAATPAKNVATVAVLDRNLAERFCETSIQGIPM